MMKIAATKNQGDRTARPSAFLHVTVSCSVEGKLFEKANAQGQFSQERLKGLV